MFWVAKKEVPERGPGVSGHTCVRTTRGGEKLCCDILCYKDKVCKLCGKREMALLEISGQIIEEDNWDKSETET